jgi:uncharacterized protein YbgA (DUF1722 family)
MSYNQENTHEMGRTISDKHKEPLEDMKIRYESLLYETLSEIPQVSSNINVLITY